MNVRLGLRLTFMLKFLMGRRSSNNPPNFHASIELTSFRTCYLAKPLCTITGSTEVSESPDLPDWIKFFDTKTSTHLESEDDVFVIPPLAHWLESQKLEDNNKVVQKKLGETCNNEVDKISTMLENRYPSPENVAEALNGKAYRVSNTLVAQLLKRFHNDWIQAYGIFKWAKDQIPYRHSPESYNSMVDILGKAKNFRLMWELVDEMNHLAGSVSLETMSKVIRRLARAGRHQEAIHAFRNIEKYGISTDTTAMNVLMDALVKEASVEDAHNVFRELKCSIPFNLASFNVLIHGYCKAKKLDEAWKIMGEVEKSGLEPDVISYTAFIEAHCREKDFRNVDKVLVQMEHKGCKPNVITFTIIMHALGKAKQINEALKVYEKMKKEGCVPDSSFYSSLIFILGKAGRLTDVKEIVEDMEKQGVTPDVLTYNTLISCACAHSQEETALTLLLKMEEVSCKPDLKTYHPLLKMFCRKKRMKVLKFLLDHMFKNDVSIEAGTYAILVRGLCENGKLHLACSFFGEMLSKAMVPKDSTFKMLKEELERKSMLEEMKIIENLMFCATNQDTS
ncbi:pentatricopeptide repeat-containing protein At3g22670, mitochondrial [Cucumis sativus]|uniref:pentatricopeptide repeat-containing protein At3g22670, mitochondrial n=1 Tax=Cucumis sativus TaxID=3659 RepID=UPI0012F47D24|nr:pentatricopeptide repeat-containing protein At3g22670, mitochondrial [Cucumis sativus]